MNVTTSINLSLINCTEAALILSVFIVGFITNLISFLVIIRHKSFYNSFGYIIAYNALANVLILLIFAVWATPWTLFAVPESVQGANLFFGQTSLFLQEAGYHCNFLLSINRFVAITFPLQYRIWFTRKSTLIMLICTSGVTLAYWATFFIETCDFYYDHDQRVWRFGLSPCSAFLGTYVDVCYNIFLFVVIGIFDSFTLVRLQVIKKTSLARKGCTSCTILVSGEMRRHHKKQVNLFVQAFATSAVHSLTLLSFNLTSMYMSGGILLFLGTTFVWESSYAIAGCLLIWFNPEIRRHLGIRESIRLLFNNTTSRVFPMTLSRS